MSEIELRDRIDDYVSSIHAMVGFANFYLWDDDARQERTDVVVFQGRRLHPVPPPPPPQEVNQVDSPPASEPLPTTEQSPNSALPPEPTQPARGEEDVAILQPQTDLSEAFVTPDVGVLLPNSTGVLAEVKLSFPKDQTHWMDDFEQLMRYGGELHGWPSSDGLVALHDVVLITKQGRATPVKKFYEARVGKEIVFERPFAIVSYNRSDERQKYYFFQRVCGALSDKALDGRLDDGVPVPMQKLLPKYSTVKLYDAKPPLPYMMDLIWTNVVIDVARDSPKFPKLKKRQKLSIELSIDDIVQRLRDGFTFRSLNANADDGSPSIPHRNWVIDACEQMVSTGDAEWFEASKKDIRVFFRKYDDPRAHFVEVCAQLSARAESRPDPQKLLNFNTG